MENNMLEGFVAGLIIAYVLTFFNVDNIIINTIQSFIPDIQITIDIYYTLFGVVGMVSGLIKELKVNDKEDE